MKFQIYYMIVSVYLPIIFNILTQPYINNLIQFGNNKINNIELDGHGYDDCGILAYNTDNKVILVIIYFFAISGLYRYTFKYIKCIIL